MIFNALKNNSSKGICKIVLKVSHFVDLNSFISEDQQTNKPNPKSQLQLGQIRAAFNLTFVLFFVPKTKANLFRLQTRRIRQDPFSYRPVIIFSLDIFSLLDSLYGSGVGTRSSQVSPSLLVQPRQPNNSFDTLFHALRSLHGS